jgi:hypothetical protein
LETAVRLGSTVLIGPSWGVSRRSPQSGDPGRKLRRVGPWDIT